MTERERLLRDVHRDYLRLEPYQRDHDPATCPVCFLLSEIDHLRCRLAEAERREDKP